MKENHRRWPIQKNSQSRKMEMVKDNQDSRFLTRETEMTERGGLNFQRKPYQQVNQVQTGRPDARGNWNGNGSSGVGRERNMCAQVPHSHHTNIFHTCPQTRIYSPPPIINIKEGPPIATYYPKKSEQNTENSIATPSFNRQSPKVMPDESHVNQSRREPYMVGTHRTMSDDGKMEMITDLWSQNKKLKEENDELRCQNEILMEKLSHRDRREKKMKRFISNNSKFAEEGSSINYETEAETFLVNNEEKQRSRMMLNRVRSESEFYRHPNSQRKTNFNFGASSKIKHKHFLPTQRQKYHNHEPSSCKLIKCCRSCTHSVLKTGRSPHYNYEGISCSCSSGSEKQQQVAEERTERQGSAACRLAFKINKNDDINERIVKLRAANELLKKLTFY